MKTRKAAKLQIKEERRRKIKFMAVSPKDDKHKENLFRNNSRKKFMAVSQSHRLSPTLKKELTWYKYTYLSQLYQITNVPFL